MEQQDFLHIITTLRPKITGLCQRFFDRQRLALDAEDAVQETLLRLWQMRDRLADYRSPEALAMMIAKNICIDMLKRADGQSVPLEPYTDAASPTQADQLAIANDTAQMIEDLQRRHFIFLYHLYERRRERLPGGAYDRNVT